MGILVAGLSIGSGNSVLELSDSTLLEFLSHHLFLFEPSVFSDAAFANVYTVAACHIRRRGLVLRILALVSRSDDGSCHVEHQIVILLVSFAGSVLLCLSLVVGSAGVALWLFRDHVHELGVSYWHVLLHESHNCFREADFEVETARPHNRGGLVAAFAQLNGALFFVHAWVELSDLNVLDGGLGGLLQDDQLVSNDALRDLLLLCRVELISLGQLVNHVNAPIGLLISRRIQDLSDIYLLLTAGVAVLTTHGAVDARFGLGSLAVHVTVSHLGDMVEQGAPVALENVQVRPDFPVDFPPGDSIGLSNEGYELLEVPRLVDHMLGSDLAIAVYVAFCLRAVKHLSLTHGEELVAVSALVEVVLLLFE